MDSQFKEVLNDAAEKNLAEGRAAHRKGDYSRAQIYYNRLIDEKRVNEQVRHLAAIFIKQVSEDYRPIIFIDPGHGGSDPGATHFGVNEKTLNLNVSNYLRTELEAKGYIVIVSRTSDFYVDLTKRAHEANNVFADIFISVHHNSMGGSGAGRGIETFIHHTVASGFGQETNKNNFKMNDLRIRESVNLAEHIHSNLINTTGLYDRGVKGNNF